MLLPPAVYTNSYSSALLSLDGDGADSKSMLWRDGPGLAYLWGHGLLLLIGGWNPDQGPSKWGTSIIETNEVWGSYNFGRTWTQLRIHSNSPSATGPNAQFTPRHTQPTINFCWKGTEYIYLLGGDQTCGDQQVWRTADGKTFEMICSDTGIGAQAFQMGGTVGSVLFVAGGQTSYLDPGSAQQKIRASYDGGFTWQNLPNGPWAARGLIYNLACYHGELCLVGGGTFASSPGDRTVYNDAWCLSSGGVWTQRAASASWPVREYHNVFVFDDQLCVANGYQPIHGAVPGGNTADMWSTRDFKSWTSWTVPWPAGHADGFCVTPGGLIQSCGNGGQFNGNHASTYRIRTVST